MKENDVTDIAQLFGLQKDIVEGSVTDGTLSVRIKDALAKKKMYSPEEFETFKRNYAEEVKNSYYSQIVDDAKKNNIPTELHKIIKGASLQQKERELSQKYGITEFSNFDDLIDKAISKTTANGTKPEYETMINDLKEANKKLLSDKENAVQDVEKKYRTQFIERDKKDLINRVPLDFSDKKADEVEKVREKTHTILKSVFDSEYRLDYDDKGRLVVMDKEGKVKKNQATLEPVDASSVMIELAKEYNLKLISPDRGGQGGQSSHSSGHSFSNYDEFLSWCKSQNIAATSAEGIKAWKTSGLKH